MAPQKQGGDRSLGLGTPKTELKVLGLGFDTLKQSQDSRIGVGTPKQSREPKGWHVTPLKQSWDSWGWGFGTPK